MKRRNIRFRPWRFVTTKCDDLVTIDDGEFGLGESSYWLGEFEDAKIAFDISHLVTRTEKRVINDGRQRTSSTWALCQFELKEFGDWQSNIYRRRIRLQKMQGTIN